jgi:hypothetical protein
MAKKPEPPKPTSWDVYEIAEKAVWLGTVEAPDKAAAIEKAAVEFRAAKRLLAIRQGVSANRRPEGQQRRAALAECRSSASITSAIVCSFPAGLVPPYLPGLPHQSI